MTATRRLRRAAGWMAGGLGLTAIGYAATVGTIWYRYGRPVPQSRDEMDPLLDRFMPEYDVAERHHVRVMAPPEITFAAAADIDLQRSPLVRAIFKTRELVLGTEPDSVARPEGLLAQMKSLGWGVLAETPGREIVVGATVQPWLANVVFRALPPDQFRDFQEPGYVKIVWTLRADPAGTGESIFRTETRVVTTDSAARSRLRWYWARFSPGIVLIRRLMLGPLKREAERRARAWQTG